MAAPIHVNIYNSTFIYSLTEHRSDKGKGKGKAKARNVIWSSSSESGDDDGRQAYCKGDDGWRWSENHWPSGKNYDKGEGKGGKNDKGEGKGGKNDKGEGNGGKNDKGEGKGYDDNPWGSGKNDKGGKGGDCSAPSLQ